MRLKPYVGLALVIPFLGVAFSVHAQSAPSAIEIQFPFAIGAGFSGYNPDYGHGHILGGTLWIDYFPRRVPSVLRGIGVEAEARDLNYGRSPALPGNLRQDTAEGGLIYSWPHFRAFRPYGKLSCGYGNADAESTKGVRFHDSRTIFSGGGGFEYRVFPTLSLRADYEYQVWPDFFKHPATVNPPQPARPSGLLNPQGFTLGAVYHFSRPHFR
jgi:opacity protein-like surface antigen